MARLAYRAALLSALILVALVDRASADVARRATARVDGQSVELLFSREADGSVTARPRRGGSSCRWQSIRWVSSSPYVPYLPASLTGPPPTPDHELYVVSCGQYTGTRWVGPRDFVDPNVDALVERARREVGLLPARIEVRPGNRGVTGVPSLFWVEGYDGATVERTESALGLAVTVRFRLERVEWEFGDGTPQVSAGLGEAWPERSSVQHNYRDVSGPEPYVVRVTLHFEPSVEGAEAGDLEPVEVTFERPYAVGQVQAVGRRTGEPTPGQREEQR